MGINLLAKFAEKLQHIYLKQGQPSAFGGFENLRKFIQFGGHRLSSGHNGDVYA